MKANELMIGDWVQGFVPDAYSQIALTTWYGRVVIFTREGQEIELNEEDIQPIPLTTEILEKNGWKCIKGGISTYFRDEITKDVCFMIQQLEGYTHWSIRLNKCKEDITFEVFLKIKYVHELQHALRLCGLSELADNFKL